MRLSTLIKHRSVWMGIAILWIVFFHSTLSVPNVLRIPFIQNIGYGGTDIFMFASGLGTYFSYTKDYDSTAFMQRRLARLAPVYLPFIVIWIIYKFSQEAYSVKEAIGNIFAVQGFTGLGNEFNWYITGLLVVYILAPYFSGLIDRINKPHIFSLLIVALLIISIPFWGTYSAIMVVTRLPIFVMGMYFAKLSKNSEKKLTGKLAVVLVGVMLVGFMILMLFYIIYHLDYLRMHGLHWYPFILITPGLCILISGLAEIAQKNSLTKGLFKILGKVGEYSFEIYLIHIFCFDVYHNYLIPAGILPRSNWSVLFVLILVIPLCLLLRVCSKGCCQLFHFLINSLRKTVRKPGQI